MQKTLIGILAMTTLALGVLCAVQWRQLRASHEQVRAAEETRRAETEARDTQTARVRELERTNRRLDEQVQKFAVVTTQLRTNEARQAETLATLAQRMQAAQNHSGGGEGEGKDGIPGKGMGEMLGTMMKDPAMREMIRDQQKSVINMMYGGLFKELKLSPEEKDRFKEILTDAQMKNIQTAQGLVAPGKEGGESAAADAGQQLTDSKKQTDAEIKALLGDERFAQYEDYQKNVGERMQLDQFKNQLTGDSQPLRDEQTALMLQAMNEEKTKIPPVIPDDRTQVPKKDMFTAENLDKQLKWMDDYNRRVLDRAGQILTPEQLKQYRSFQEQQASMQKLGLQMAKQMFGGEKAASPPLTAPVK